MNDRALPEDLIGTRSAAQLLDCSKKTVIRYITVDERLEGFKVGGRWKMRRTAVMQLIEAGHFSSRGGNQL